MSTASRFLMRVWKYQQPEEGDYVFISTKVGNIKDGQWKDHGLRWPVTHEKIDQLIANYRKAHVYFCPVIFKTKRRYRTEAKPSRLLWADLDEADPRQINLRPAIAWESSPNRYSAIWCLSEAYKPQTIELNNKALTYDCGADKGGWDLTQVLRLPGTRNWKYPDGPKVTVLWDADTRTRLEDIPDLEEKPKVKINAQAIWEKWKKKLPRELFNRLTKKSATVGYRSSMLWRMEHELRGHKIPKEEVFALIKVSPWNKFKGRNDEDAQLWREIGKVFSSDAPPETEESDKPKSTFNGTVVRLSDVEAEEVSWLWYPYIPRGKVTLVEGDPGLGKSWLTLALATHLSLKKPFPESDNPRSGKTLFFSAEDGLADTIKPRLVQLGADSRRIFAYNEYTVFDDDSLAVIEGQIEELKPALVVVDPLVAYMGGGVDLHKANETREVMAKLAKLAEKYNLAIVAVRHLTKGGRDKSIYRGIGSIDLTAAARSVLLVGRNPKSMDGRAFIQIKNNLASMGVPIGFNLRPDKKKPFKWAGAVDLTPDEIFSASSDQSDRVEEMKSADAYVKEHVDSRRVAVDRAMEKAESKGISPEAFDRAMRKAGYKRKQLGEEEYYVDYGRPTRSSE